MPTLGLITGGDGKERDISLQSAEGLRSVLHDLGYSVIDIDYPKQKTDLHDLINTKTLDMAWVMVHGRGGEDGQIQRLLEKAGVPSQTASAAALELSFDKYLTKLEWKKSGLPVAPSLIIDSFVDDLQTLHFDILQKVKYPCIAKETREGSSFGITFIKDQHDLKDRRETRDARKQYLIEAYMKGKEITVGILETNEGSQVLPCIQISFDGNIRDTTSKYGLEIQKQCPAPLPDEMSKQCQTLALDAYHALGMSKYGRVDMILATDGPVLLELNSIPGFTPTSLYPKAAGVYGIDFPQLVAHLTDLALG